MVIPAAVVPQSVFEELDIPCVIYNNDFDINMSLLITHTILIALSGVAIIFLYKYRAMLLDKNSELYTTMMARYSRMFVYLKYSIPVIIVGFILNILNSLLNIVTIALQGP